MTYGGDRTLEQRIDKFNSSYEKGANDWFDYFADDATIYTIGSTEPIKGRRAYEENFKDLLREKRQVEVLQRDVQVMGDTAVVMQLVEVTQTQVVSTFRESTIWRRDGDWKVIHMHTSLVTDPAPVAGPKDARSVRVLSQRIAAVSAQVGVAQ